MPAEFLLRENQIAVHGHLEDAAARGDNDHLGQVMLQLVQQFRHQTGGAVFIPSNRAVFDANIHDGPPAIRYAVYASRTMRERSDVVDAAPPIADQSGGGGGGWAWLVTARGIIEAELIKGVLESAGIVPVALDSRDPTPGAWMYMSGNVNRLVRVYVPASLLDRARLELLESGLSMPDAAEPEPRVSRAVQLGGWRIVAIVAAALIIIGFIVATWHGHATG